MSSLNKAMIIGNVTKDVELKTLESGNTVCSFAVATNRKWKNANGEPQEQAEFHNVVAWGKLAEICAKFLKKGNKVYLDGRLQTREWENKEGEKRRQTEIVAANMVMLTPKSANQEQTHDDLGGVTSHPESSEDEIKLEDIPF